jgi:hypothetical protein
MIKVHKTAAFTMERYGRLPDMDRSFDIAYWQRLGPAAIFEAAWQMVVNAQALPLGGPDDLRLRRTVEEFSTATKVGGYAVMLYTEPRYTKDLDVWVLANLENAAKVWRALAEFGAPLAGLCPDDFAHEGFFYQIGQPPVRVDIPMSIDGVKFEEAWPKRRQSHLGAQPAWFISREDLLKNKRTMGRHIDLHYAA